MSTYFSEDEIQKPAEREQKLFKKLADFIDFAKQNSRYYANYLAAVDSASITSRQALASLPITRKSDLIKLQKNDPLFAGLVPENAKIDRIYSSPGPINEPENNTHDWWRYGQAFHAAGFRETDIVHNCLSYHLTPGGFILDSGARACGCSVIAAGPGQTDQQLEVIAQLKPTGYCGTPSFLKILLDKAKNNSDISSINKALVTGEAFMPALKQEFADAGINTLQAYGTADIGLIAFESEASPGLILAENIILELVRPGSQELVKEGEVGEIVITSFNTDYPLIRFATGDLTAILAGTSPCGRTNLRIKGWLGRADQTSKVKGMFVHPEQIEKIRQQYPQITNAKLIITNSHFNDVISLACEVRAQDLNDASLSEKIRQTVKQVLKLNGDVELVSQGTLANDGKVIDDRR